MNIKRMEQILLPLGIRRGYSPLSDQNSLEACQIAKFLCQLGDDNPKLQKNESPDFIVTFSNGLKIGLEHMRILTEFGKSINSLKSLIQKAENEFREKYTQENKVFAGIAFHNDYFAFTKTEQPKYAGEIADYVYYVLNNIESQRPNYLKKVRVDRFHDRIGFVYDYDEWKHIALTRKILQKSILSKESKLSKYNGCDQDIDEYWLVVVIGALSSASYELDSQVDYRMDSSFDRVFLFCDFDANIISIK